jgi:23S rRNA pseudouridine2605 synthase
VFEKLPTSLPRVVSVGRLDINSEGLLLLTNDGELARRLELPAQGWVRRYRVRVHGDVIQRHLDRLANGITVEGIHYGPVTAELERTKGHNSWLTISLKEGKNREVKRLMEHLGLKVARLIRVSFGPFHLGHLPEGQVDEIAGKVWREQLGMQKPKARREHPPSGGSRHTRAADSSAVEARPSRAPGRKAK